jgi:hypothetical protein
MKTWATPSLVEYGRVEEITMGVSGSLPDLNQNLNVINNDCPTGTFLENGVVMTRVACVNASS